MFPINSSSPSYVDLLPEAVSSMFGKIALVMTLSAEVGARTSLYCATEPSLSDPQYSGDVSVLFKERITCGVSTIVFIV